MAHIDLKSKNVMLKAAKVSSEDRVVAMLTDFGTVLRLFLIDLIVTFFHDR